MIHMLINSFFFYPNYFSMHLSLFSNSTIFDSFTFALTWDFLTIISRKGQIMITLEGVSEFPTKCLISTVIN